MGRQKTKVVVLTYYFTENYTEMKEFERTSLDLPWIVLVLLKICKILVSARFCGVCAR